MTDRLFHQLSQQLTFNLNFYSQLRIREGLNIYRSTGADEDQTIRSKAPEQQLKAT